METRITNNKQINDLFKEINIKLIERNKEIDIYLIGGGALMFYGAKSSTKDLDIILKDTEDFSLIRDILRELDFNIKCDLESEYDNFEIEDILIRGDYRLDIFNKQVCRKLEITQNMIDRCNCELNLSNLKLNVLSLEDIFVFKSITDRDGDVEDSVEIVKKGIDWEIIEKEILEQINNTGKNIWITYVAGRLQILNDEYGIQSPIEKRIVKLAEDYCENLK